MKTAAIILAAGVGKRMKSSTSKVLHEIAGKPMILRSISNVRLAGVNKIIVVVNRANYSQIKKMTSTQVKFAMQEKQMGTADAARIGLSNVDADIDTVLIVNGDDSAFYKPETIKRIIKRHIDTNSVQTFLSVRVKNPYGLGRVIKKNGRVIKVVEEKEANDFEKKIKVINAGLYAFNRKWLEENLPRVNKSPVTGEKYLVDLVRIAIKRNRRVTTYLLKESGQWHGINTRKELTRAQEQFNKKIHIMGVAGAGAWAVAGIAKGYGFEVTGCDIHPESSYTKNFKHWIVKDHSKTHIHNIAKLVVSPAIIKNDPKNSELAEAKRQKIPVITWQEFQGKYLQKDKFVISIAGGYGKSTTTAMISKILTDSRLDPTCEIGAKVLEWDTNFRVGKSEYYVNEADEYNDNFLNYNPDIALILNVAWDHPDYFINKESLFNSYRKFINNIKKNGYLLIGDDKELVKLTKFTRADIKIVKIKRLKDIRLSIIGEFRKDNASAALKVAETLNLDLNKAKKSIQNFRGVGRRLEFKGEINGVKVYDDYAVQPTTVIATANALSGRYKSKKVVLVFEPHTYSRIETFFDDFVTSLKNTKVECILITDIFAAREKGDREDLAKKLKEAVGKKAFFTGSLKKTANYLKKNFNKYDVILSMGAGDVYKIYDFLVDQLHNE